MIVFVSRDINYKICMRVHLIVGFCMSEICKSTLISHDFISRFVWDKLIRNIYITLGDQHYSNIS